MIGAPVYVCNVSSDESEEYLDVSPDENEETLLDLPVMNWGGAEGSTAHNNVENEDEEHLDLPVMNYGRPKAPTLDDNIRECFKEIDGLIDHGQNLVNLQRAAIDAEEHLDLPVMNYGNANERRVANRQSEEHLDLPPIW
jgi:hypothetical protein